MSIFSISKEEKEVLKVLDKSWKSYREIAKELNKNLAEVLRILYWLNKNGLVEIIEKEKEIVKLGKNGLKYKEIGLPEYRIYEYLKEIEISDIESIKKALELEDEEIKVAIGILKKLDLIDLIKKEKVYLKIKRKDYRFVENEFIKNFIEKEYKEFDENEKKIIDSLIKRKDILVKKKIKEYYVRITDKGEKVREQKEEELIEVLDSEIIKKRDYLKKKFKEFDIYLDLKPCRIGKKHPYLKYIEYVRRYMLSLGFKEMEYRFIISHFWNMDSLFLPQDHPAGELSLADFFLVKNPKYIEDFDKEIYEKVKEQHKKYYKIWEDSVAKRCILISHITALSAITFTKVEIPGKYFSIDRVFRYDTIDAKHHIEFRQLEGFVISEKVNFRNLIGLLIDISKVLAKTNKVKVYPAYFPFTEPSIEIYVKHPTLGWIEVGGAGIIRREILNSFNIKEEVIAWGIGIDRLAMIYLGIDDIRNIYTKDLKWLINRKIPYV